MAADPLDALRLPVVPVDPRPEFTAALLRRIRGAGAAAGPAAPETAPGPAAPETAPGPAAPETAPGPPAPAAAAGPAAPAAAADHPTVRYFVRDLDAAIAFYCRHLGFEEELRSPPAFAMLYGGGLRLLLSVPGQAGAGRPLPDGTVPEAGGSNRITLKVPDLTAAVRELSGAGVRIRAGLRAGVTVRQALVEDPSGNLVELYEPAAGYHERT